VRWLTSWGCAVQRTEPDNLPPSQFIRGGRILPDTTMRQTIRVSLGGSRLRLRLSNVFGTAPVAISRAGLAIPVEGRAGVSRIQTATSRPVTFDGLSTVVIPTGAEAISDPVALAVAPQTNLTVTVHLADGQAGEEITSHPGSRTTTYLVFGDHVDDLDLPGATPVDHWYLLTALDVPATAGARAVAILGDSLTDGRGSTTNGNDRWPDRLLARLQADPRGRSTAVLNVGLGGNRLLQDGLGPSGMARLDRDVLSRTGVAWLIVFEGINDIGTTEASVAGQAKVSGELIAAYQHIANRTQAQGIQVSFATLLPFGGNDLYDDPAGHREAARQAVNTWIRTSSDRIVDFDLAARDRADPRRLRPEIDDGDHLHLNPTGYRLLGDAVPLDLFD
jgi:lysophospholipase L1-like esterase